MEWGNGGLLSSIAVATVGEGWEGLLRFIFVFTVLMFSEVQRRINTGCLR